MADLNFNITSESIRQDIFALADEKYRKFHSSLVPGEDTIIGVRIPVLRKYAGELYSSWKGAGEASACDLISSAESVEGLLAVIGDRYYEEIMLQGMLIGMQKVRNRIPKRTHKGSKGCSGSDLKTISINELYTQIEAFVPKINNWAICDIFCAGLKQVKKYPEETYEFLQKFLRSDDEYSIRFGLVMLLDYYIQAEYLDRIFDTCNEISRKEAYKKSGDNSNAYKGQGRYYVKMAVAWLISISFVKFYEETKNYMLNCCLDDWTYNKAIQKARESRRIAEEQKEELLKMKR